VLVKGVPTFWARDGGNFVYWDATSRQWWFTTKSKLDEVQACLGARWSSEKFDKDDIVCDCRDDPEGVAGFSGLHCNEADLSKYSNVKCEAVEYSGVVQTCCPVFCGVSACSGSAAAPVPAPAPKPTPNPTPPPASSGSGGSGSECKDHEGLSITVNGESVTCAYTDLCKEVNGFE